MVNPLSGSAFRQKDGAVMKEARESTYHILGVEVMSDDKGLARHCRLST